MFYTLDYIIDKEPFVLFDASARPHYDYFNLTVEWYGLRSYRQLGMEAMQNQIKSFREFNRFIKQPNVFTIPEVFAELVRLLDFLSEKEHMFDRHKEAFIRLKRSHKAGVQKRLMTRKTMQEQKFKDFYKLVREHGAKIRHSFYNPKNPVACKLLEDIVCLVDDFGECKRRYVYYEQYSNPATLRPTEDLRTDEKLVATALYMSLFENKPTAIVCRDKDFKKLLYGCKHVFAEEIPFSEYLLARLHKNPITLYEHAHKSLFFKRDKRSLIGRQLKFCRLGKNNHRRRIAKYQITQKLYELYGHIAFCSENQ